MELGKVFTDSVTVPDRMRALDPAKVERLAESMAAIGLQQPISIWNPNEDTVLLVAGNHRLAAARKLGWVDIDCFYVNLDDIDRQLWEIDENLMRAELTPAQEAEHLKRRKELWEARQNSVAICNTNRGRPKAFATDTAEKTGVDRSTVHRAVARAEKVAVINDVVGTSLDKGVELDALAKLPEHEQRRLAERAKAGERVSARKPVKLPDEPLNDFEITQKQVSALMSAWNKASREAREQFLEMIDRPTFDRTRSGEAA